MAPGKLTFTVNAGEAVHNANSVGAGKPFQPGFYYEVVLETSDPKCVLPTVEVWAAHGNEVIPGTCIGPAEFREIKTSPRTFDPVALPREHELARL